MTINLQPKCHINYKIRFILTCAWLDSECAEWQYHGLLRRHLCCWGGREGGIYLTFVNAAAVIWNTRRVALCPQVYCWELGNGISMLVPLCDTQLCGFDQQANYCTAPNVLWIRISKWEKHRCLIMCTCHQIQNIITLLRASWRQKLAGQEVQEDVCGVF